MPQTKASPANPRPCGQCTLCCRLYAVPELSKLAGDRCEHEAPGHGCMIHAMRPQSCRRYQCAWSVTEAFGPEWRPDIAGFAIGTRQMEMIVETDPARPDSWKADPYYTQLKRFSMRNKPSYLTVIIRTRGHALVMFPETEIDLGIPPVGSEIESGYEDRNGKGVPFARFVSTAS